MQGVPGMPVAGLTQLDLEDFGASLSAESFYSSICRPLKPAAPNDSDDSGGPMRARRNTAAQVDVKPNCVQERKTASTALERSCCKSRAGSRPRPGKGGH